MQKEVFAYLINSFLVNNRTWEYFINWQKVYQRTADVQKELNILNASLTTQPLLRKLVDI